MSQVCPPRSLKQDQGHILLGANTDPLPMLLSSRVTQHAASRVPWATLGTEEKGHVLSSRFQLQREAFWSAPRACPRCPAPSKSITATPSLHNVLCCPSAWPGAMDAGDVSAKREASVAAWMGDGRGGQA